MHKFHNASNRKERNISILDSKIDLKSLNLVSKDMNITVLNSNDLNYEI